MDVNRPPERPGPPNTQHQTSFTFPTFRSLNDHSMVHHRNFQRDGAMTGRARRHPGETVGLAGPHAEKTVSLALQGGGAHGAFTWGVLDALLEDGRLAVEAITGASAGAVNAVVMVEGWLDGGIDGARSHLETFWRRASLDGSLSPAQRALLGLMLGFWSKAWTDVIAPSFSPYRTNPLNINPLRDAIDALIDFDRVRACTDVEIFISATNVWTGKVAIFKTQELTADHLMASACLPTVFQAVEIDGVPYWDGGYMGNPALFPLFDETMTDDIVLVQINPLERRQTPRTVREIHNRLNEITFNSTLLRELRAVAFVKRLIEEGKLSPDEYKNVHLHRIDASGVLDDHEASSKSNAEWDFFVQLRDAGRRTARSWLAAHYGAIGERGTLDLQSALP
jgi:NTE family protein